MTDTPAGQFTSATARAMLDELAIHTGKAAIAASGLAAGLGEDDQEYQALREIQDRLEITSEQIYHVSERLRRQNQGS